MRPGKQVAAQVGGFLNGKTILGLQASIGVPDRPEAASVACRVRLTGREALVQMASSDGVSGAWVAVGKFTLPVAKGQDKFDPARFSDGLAEGMLGRLVRAQLVKGPRDKGKVTYAIKIDNGSPLVLHGLAVAGAKSEPDAASRVLWGIGVAPRRSLVLPASEEAVKAMGFKQGIRVTAADIGGL